MSADVLATEDLDSAAWLFAKAADEVDAARAGMHDLPHYLALATVSAHCNDTARGLRLLAATAARSDNLLQRGFSAAAHGAAALGRVARTHPELAGVAAAAAPEAFLTAVGALDLVSIVAKGEARVHDEGFDPAPAANRPPRSAADLADGVAMRDRAKHGAIDVKLVQQPGGGRAIIVDITGLATKSPRPGGDAASLPACVRAATGLDSAYEDGVIEAMEQAGVQKDEPILMVGHSLGGLIAVDATRTLRRKGYNVTHVMTEGAPIGRITGGLPQSIKVLAFENRNDYVPRLDLAGNPHRPNQRTVSFDQPGMHDSGGVYAPGVATLGSDARIREFERSAHAFLDGSSVQTHRFTITKTVF